MEPLDEHVREAVMQRMDLTRNLSDQDILSIIMEEICCLGKEQFISMEQRVEIQKIHETSSIFLPRHHFHNAVFFNI